MGIENKEQKSKTEKMTITRESILFPILLFLITCISILSMILFLSYDLNKFLEASIKTTLVLSLLSFSAGLKILSELQKKIKKYSKHEIDIASIFLIEKQKKQLLVATVYVITIAFFLVFSLKLYSTFLTFILLLLIAQQQLLEYRIKKGYYVNNADEALELIKFIVANSEKIDFSDGDGGVKRLLPKAEKETEKKSVIAEGAKT